MVTTSWADQLLFYCETMIVRIAIQIKLGSGTQWCETTFYLSYINTNIHACPEDYFDEDAHSNWIKQRRQTQGIAYIMHQWCVSLFYIRRNLVLFFFFTKQRLCFNSRMRYSSPWNVLCVIYLLIPVYHCPANCHYVVLVTIVFRVYLFLCFCFF